MYLDILPAAQESLSRVMSQYRNQNAHHIVSDPSSAMLQKLSKFYASIWLAKTGGSTYFNNTYMNHFLLFS